MGLALLSLISSASADRTWTDVWSQDDWADGSNVGVDGWWAGYGDEEWWGHDGRLETTTDEHEDDPVFGDGGPSDNWLVKTDTTVADGAIEVRLRNDDDDSVGVLLRFVDGANTYLAVLAGTDEPLDNGVVGSNPFDLDNDTVAIVRISEGQPHVLATTEGSYERGEVHVLRFDVDGDTLTLELYEDDDDEPRTVLQTRDDSPLGPGGFGIWAYDSGDYGDRPTRFGDLDVFALVAEEAPGDTGEPGGEVGTPDGGSDEPGGASGSIDTTQLRSTELKGCATVRGAPHWIAVFVAPLLLWRREAVNGLDCPPDRRLRH